MPTTMGPQIPSSASSLESVQSPVVSTVSPSVVDENPEFYDIQDWCGPTAAELAERVQVMLSQDVEMFCGDGPDRVVRPRRRRHPQLELVAMVEVGAIDPPDGRRAVVIAIELPPPRRQEVRLPKETSDWRHPHKGRPSRAMLRSAEE